jgi:adenylate cyclase
MVGVVAATFSNIVDRNLFIPSSPAVDLLIIISVGILITFFSHRLKPLKAAILSISAIVVWCVFSYFLFVKRIVVPVFYPASTGFFTFLGMTIYRVVSEEKEKKFIKNMFQRYVSSQIVDELIKNPEMLALGGQRRYLSVFFSDIRGFTSMSEKMQPEEIVKILNEYLTEMTDIIFRYRGTLDKFIGDAVMAIWGAPHYLKNHAELAIRAALEMQKKVAQLCEMWKQQNMKQIGIGMGINTGDVVCGNMGSATFSDYTVIGDNVNLAARLEENAKAGQILISQATFEEVSEIVKVRKMPPLKVKGKEKPIEVYEVLDIL